MADYTAYHSQYLAHRITLEGIDEDAFAKSLSSARVDMNPHQVDAALFALQPPIPRGAILADEVGLGKTIEAGLVIAQRWAEGHRRILLIVPASLRKQWTQELFDKFGIPASILEAKSYRERQKQGHARPFEVDNHVVVTSYEFGALKADDLRKTNWNLVIFDEAHRLRNVYRKGASKRAKALRDALTGTFKLLLTATPLQNSLMELYGLVSVVDDKLFGDEASFKTTYGGRPDPATLLILRDRLKPICRRTLRKDVQEAGHINYTKRIPVTFKFEPHDNEVKLYEGLSAYLQRKDTIAFGEKPNQLITLVVRKILGSSTFAVAQTLESIIVRLKAMQRPNIEDLSDLDDADEIAEEWTDSDDAADNQEASIDPAKLKTEIAELEAYLALARSININAKGEKLIGVLDEVLDRIASLGGKRKAVIFTESVRTQKYLADLLAANGYAGQIALMNGQNNDPQSQAIYINWKTRHEGSDAISGSKTADMKAAIVEAFRENKTILIATESGAEGINLQFCSLLMNFDLPWNPQRVEQRIGRCHRYGQAIDVLVVNFLNLKNRAEERVFELLDKKFKLFGGVFGASDEVLGAIESGTDFERRVFEIHQSARNKGEIDAEFDRLQAELDEQIMADVLDARGKLMGFFDQDVVRILKHRKDTIDSVISAFEERLITIARAELPDSTFSKHANGKPVFNHNGETWTTGWPLADEQGWKFFRLADGNLASTLTASAKARTLPLASLTFDYSAYGNGVLANVKQHIGRSGWLRVSRLAVRTANQTVVREDRLEDYLVVHLLDYNQVDYDANSDLLYKLARQMLAHLRSYLSSDEDVESVLLHQGKSLAQFIFRQMMADGHYVETPTKYRARVSKGFQVLQNINFRVADTKAVRDFRAPVVPPSDTRRYVYGSFKRCLYEHQSFQSDEERRFAVLIDSDHEPDVLRWVKPGSKQFQIEFRRGERYEPDFVVETKAEKLIVEIKARRDLEDETVRAKAKAARTWVGHANDHAKTYGGKPWRYVLIPHDAMLENVTLAGLASKFAQTAIVEEPVPA